MSQNLPVFQGQYTVQTSSVQTATQSFTRDQIMNPSGVSGANPEASGIIAYLNVTAVPGTQSLQLVLDEYDPVSQVWQNICSTLTNTATGMMKLKLKEAITVVAATANLVVVQDKLPWFWRIRVINSGGSFTYSLGVTLYN